MGQPADLGKTCGDAETEGNVDWSHFGFNRPPFRPVVDPGSYFAAPSHEEALAGLAAGFARRDPVVLIDGKIGVGKSLVVSRWLEQLPESVTRLVVPNAFADKPAALLQAILFDWGKPYQGLTDAELRLNLTGHLLDAASESADPIVLVLDEAQHLSHAAIEELRLLGNLQTHRGPVLFTVLAAQTTLRDALRRPAYELFEQRVAGKFAVEPLTPAETADYLRHQIKVAGGDVVSVFAEDALTLLVSAGEGVPRVLNRAAALAFELAAGAEAETVDVEAVLEAVERLGLTIVDPENGDEQPDDPSDVVLLPHPARTEQPARPSRRKAVGGENADEDAGTRGPKDRASRKRSV